VRQRYRRQHSEIHGDIVREQRMAMESSHGKTASG